MATGMVANPTQESKVSIDNGRRGIAPTRDCTHLKKCIKSFCMHNAFSYNFPSLSNLSYNRNKSRPLRPRIKF